MQVSHPTDAFDDKDVVLLLALVTDCRTPLSALAERVGLSVSATSARIDRLEQAGVIKTYKLTLNHRAFPFNEFDITYELQDATPQIIDLAVQQLSACPFSTQVLTTMGGADIRASVLARDTHHLHEILGIAETKFSSHVKQRFILGIVRKFKSNPASFLSALFARPVVLASTSQINELYHPTACALDVADTSILRELASNPRATFAAVAKAVKLTPEAVSHRVKSLEDRRIILGYSALLDGPLLGFRWAVLQLAVRSLADADREEIRKALQNHPSVTSAVETIGPWNLSVTFFGESLESLRKTELDFRARFQGRLSGSSLLFILRSEKYPALAEGILQTSDMSKKQK